jgi:hypothetical protein
LIGPWIGGVENNEDVDLMRDGEKMVLVENAFVLAGMEGSRRRLVAAIAALTAAVFADDIMM